MPRSTPKLMPMQPADVSAVAAIEARQHRTPWAASSFDDALRSGWHTQLLRDESNSILGYFVAMTAGDDEELLTLTVAPEATGRGYGRLLLENLIAAATQRGAQRLLLEVRASNAPAIHLYETAGFTIIGVRKNYYAAVSTDETNIASEQAARREDALCMALLLKPLNAAHSEGRTDL